jgi:hypothetical protein
MPNKLLVRFLFILSFFVATNTFAQVSQSPDGILFQALATDATGHPAAGRTVNVKAAIISKTATGSVVYSETFKVPASAAGVFTIVLGKGTYVSGVASIASIDWSNGPFFLNLKVAVEPTIPNSSWNVNNEYVDLGTSQFWSVPYALYAGTVKGADMKVNLSDTANMLKPYLLKTDTASLSARINLKANTADMTAALALKANTADMTAALALKANTADVNTALGLKANTADVDAALALKANTADVNTALGLKANTADVDAALALKELLANKSINVATDAASDTKYPSVKSIKTYVDAQVAAATIADASASVKGKIQLAGDLAGNAAAPTVPGLLAKENLSNKSESVTTDGTSNAKYPTVKSVKDYVDAQIAAIPAPRPTALATDEFVAGAGQTSFTLTRIPSSKVSMFVNGIRIPNAAYSFVGSALTFDANNNGSHSLVAGDRVQFDYSYLDN